MIMAEVDELEPLMKTIDSYWFGSASFPLKKMIFLPILPTKGSITYWSAGVAINPIGLLCHKKEI